MKTSKIDEKIAEKITKKIRKLYCQLKGKFMKINQEFRATTMTAMRKQVAYSVYSDDCLFHL